MRKIDHIAIKVEDIESAYKKYEFLGFTLNSIQQHDEVGMRIALLGQQDAKIELLQQTSSKSPIYDMPLGVHHIAFKCTDIEAEYKRLQKEPTICIKGDIRQGAQARIFFFTLVGEAGEFEFVEIKN